MHKNLQRDFRDIKTEFDKLAAHQSSEVSGSDQLQRAQLRLREIMTILSAQSGSRLIDPADVNALIHHIQDRTSSPSSAV